ncbi:MAG: CpaF family protein [Actinomycetota bacterium]|nr:CpaF family protein [Actinomycetota bacterium]
MFTRIGSPATTSATNLPPGAVRQVRTRLYADMAPAEILRRLKVNAGQVRKELRQAVLRLIAVDGLVLSQTQKDLILRRVLDDVLGYGPIEPLLSDPSISEIMINGPYMVYAERDGCIERTDYVFEDADHLMNVIDKIIAPIGRRVDESSPMVDARLPDGSRVNIVVPPVALSGPTVTIRRFRAKVFDYEELVDNGTIPAQAAEYLAVAVTNRANIIVTGGTGSGKTTLLNAISSLIPANERIVTIEDAAELKFTQPHVVRMESRPANVEGVGRIAIRDLVINALRMRPDRIVVGEVRGGEALDMLQAMNTGHDGSLTTAHANSPKEALSRLETMTLMAGIELPIAAVRQQITGAFDLIVHMEREASGRRRVTAVDELRGIVDGEIVLGSIYRSEE